MTRKEAIQKWIELLRSGDYQLDVEKFQWDEKSYSSTGLACLACEGTVPVHRDEEGILTGEYTLFGQPEVQQFLELHPQVEEYLIRCNDATSYGALPNKDGKLVRSGWNFDEAADWIEKNLLDFEKSGDLATILPPEVLSHGDPSWCLDFVGTPTW